MADQCLVRVLVMHHGEDVRTYVHCIVRVRFLLTPIIFQWVDLVEEAKTWWTKLQPRKYIPGPPMRSIITQTRSTSANAHGMPAQCVPRFLDLHLVHTLALQAYVHFKSPRDVARHTEPMRLVQGSCSSPRDPASVATFVMLHHAH